ncbi:MAG: M56 family metallopeptidase, partial [Planctomycetota bacterium]
MNAAINTIITVLNSAGRGFAEYATGLFVQSSVLIVLILILDFALRKRVRAVFRYCVWMLVFTKLVLPTSFTLPTGVGYWLGDFLPAGLSAARNPADMEEAGLLVMPNQQPEPARNDAVVVETPPSVIDYRSQLNVGESPATVPATSMARPDVGASQIELQPISWQGGLFLGWLVGMLALSVLLVQRARYVRRLLAQAKQPDERLQDLLGECRIAMGMTCDVGLRISKEMVSPAVCGLVRPTILLPRYLVEKLSREKLRAVLLHECAHVKRWDLWINLVQTVLQIAYFYNPFVWLANATVRKVREQAVDETVLVALRGESDSYSNTLIDIGEMAFWRPNFSLRLIGVVESKKALAARIKHIAARPMPKSAELGVVGLIAVVLIGVVLLPMAKAERSASRPSVIENPYVRIDQPVESMIYWTDPDRRKILRADLDGTSVTEIVSTKTALFDVALDLVHGKVYWTEPEARLIKRANLDGSYIEVVAESLENPACIALDPQRGKIYWTDLQGGRIRRANLDGSAIEDLVSTGLEKPEGICIDTARGRIYWTDIGTRKIQRANMDGTYVEDLVTSEVKYPRGIVLDVGAEKMYWTDLFPPRIRRANMDGSRVEDVIKAERLSPDGRRGRLYVDYVDPDDGPRVCDYDPESVLRDPDILRLHLEAGKMYWTDLYKKKVLCANLDGTGVREVITGYGPRGIDLALSAPVSVPGMPAGTSGRSVDLSRPQTPRASEPALVVHWKFDEGSGTMTYDSAGKNHGIVQGAVWTTGKIGTGLGFDGVDDVVNTAMNLDQSRSSRPVTFCAWVYPTSISAGRHQVISSDNRGYDWSLLRQADTWYVFTGENSRSTGFSVDLFTWQHVAAAFVPGAGVRFYKNGNEFTIPHIDYDDRDNNIAIGDNPGLGEEFFAGVIDDVRIYNTALSAEEVEQIRGITARRRKAPAGYWKFDEGGGSMAYDSAGTNHAVIKGARWTGGRVNGGLSFDGVDDRVKIPGSTVSGTELTLNLWVKTSDDTYSLVSGANEECDNEYLLYVHSGHGSKLEIYYHDNVGLLGTGFYSTDIVTNDGMWHMITVVTSLNETRVYVDGFLKEVAGYGSENSFNIEGLWIGAEQDRVN